MIGVRVVVKGWVSFTWGIHVKKMVETFFSGTPPSELECFHSLFFSYSRDK